MKISKTSFSCLIGGGIAIVLCVGGIVPESAQLIYRGIFSVGSISILIGVAKFTVDVF